MVSEEKKRYFNYTILYPVTKYVEHARRLAENELYEARKQFDEKQHRLDRLKSDALFHLSEAKEWLSRNPDDELIKYVLHMESEMSKPIESNYSLTDRINETIYWAKENGLEVGKLSDGYHTFDELYEHRYLLFINYASAEVRWVNVCRSAGIVGFENVKNPFYITRLHSDGTPSYKGYFIAGLFHSAGAQITYHLPDRMWDLCGMAEELEKAPQFDGHTSDDVLKRLAEL